MGPRGQHCHFAGIGLRGRGRRGRFWGRERRRIEMGYLGLIGVWLGRGGFG